MKKVIVLLTLSSMLFTACSKTTESRHNNIVDSSELPVSSANQVPQESAEYDGALNPYNVQTALTEDCIFVSGNGTIYRIDRKSGESQIFISESTHGVLVGYSPLSSKIATCGDDLFFLSPNHFINQNDQTTIDTFEVRLFRTNIHDESITQVGVVGNATYSLNNIQGRLVVHNLNDQAGYRYSGDLPEMEKDEAFKIFFPSSIHI